MRKTHHHAPRIDIVRTLMAQRRTTPIATQRPPAAGDRRELWQRRLSAYVRASHGQGSDGAPPLRAWEDGGDEDSRLARG